MLEYGYKDYTMHIGEHLGNPQQEKVTTLTLEEAAQHEFTMPNCVILSRKEEGGTRKEDSSVDKANLVPPSSFLLPRKEDAPRTSYLVPRYFGIPDSAFTLLDGREKMITKMPIRLLTLQALDLPRRHVLWDIGACTGSVSIEARLLFPHLQVEAFEIRPECEAIIRENARRFGAPGIGIHIGDFLQTPVPVGSPAASPDAVFIGGHGGHLKDIMAKVLTVLAPDGIIVMNSVIAPKVTRDSHQLWNEACAELGLTQEPPTRIQLNDNHPITILRCKR
jgi:precorrin-6Y C5,15-methyltransferase (decarboxylating)